MFASVVFLSLTAGVIAQNRDGESCIDRNTNTAGICINSEKCISALEDFQRTGIQPTFCQDGPFGAPILCCRDKPNPETTPVNKNQGAPVWGVTEQPRNKRVSERKCQQYSKAVTQKVDFLPLLPAAEPISITAPMCEHIGVELILGGETTSVGEYPHMAAIGWTTEGGYSFVCGGSLINARFVLTAGHCTRNPNEANAVPAVVRLGDQNLDPSVDDGANPIDIPIKTIHKHPDFRPPRKYNDIALLELASDVQFTSSIRPACLWSRPDFGPYTDAVATGWGVTNYATKEKSNDLQKVTLTLVDNASCDQKLNFVQNRLWNGTAPSQMCAGELKGGRGTCQGDSGSPLSVISTENQCIFYVLGVTNFGRKCGSTDLPTVFSRVSSYLDWIESVAWPGE